MQDEIVEVWNIAEILDDNEKVKLVNRTSNGLEHYNRHFNSILPSHHPNSVSFAKAIRDEADQVIQRMENIDKRREIPPKYNEPVFPEIPDEFWKKVSAEKKKKAKVGGRRKRV